jgi:MFS family permease
MGLGASAAFLAVFAELLETAPVPWRGRLANGFEAMAIASLWGGGILAAALTRLVGWRGVFAGVGLLLGLSLTVWRRIGPTAGRSRGSSEGSVAWPRGAMLRPFLAVYAAGLTMAMTWSGLFSTLVPLLGHARYGLTSEALGVALGAAYVAELLGLIGLSLIIDRMPRGPVFLAGALSVAGGGLVLALAARPEFFVVGLMLVGGGFAGWMIPAMALADRAGTPLPPAHLAIYRVALDIGMVVGPLLLGSLAQLAGDRVAVGAAGLVLVVGALALGRR